MKNICLLIVVSLSLLVACNESDTESDRSKTIRLLTDNDMKVWSIYEYFQDDQLAGMSPCDSSYILTMKADFSWQDAYKNFQCYQSTTGQWALNDENNVITIAYIDWSSGQQVERKFEITELTEDFFSYQFSLQNTLRRIRMKVYD